MAPLSALCERSDFKLVHLNSRSHNGEIVQLQSALNDDYNNFQEKSNTNHISEPIIGRFFPRPCACTFTSEQFHSFIQLRKETLQHFARFWRLFRSVMWSRSILVPFYLGVSLSFFLFLDFITTSDCVFNNKNNCVLRHTGYQIIITILVISSTPSLYANLRVATRVYDVEGGAIFSKNSTFVFFDGAAWTPRLRSPSPIMAPAPLPSITMPPPRARLVS